MQGACQLMLACNSVIRSQLHAQSLVILLSYLSLFWGS